MILISLMKKTIFTLIFSCVFIGNVQAQFGRRELKKDLSREYFVKLIYHSMNDSVVAGYGFPDPTSSKHIVFTKERPTEETTRDWKQVKVKYAELYYNKLIMLTRGVTHNVKYSTDKTFLKDTLRVYFLKNKGGGVANGLQALRYENDNVRLFEDILWEGYYPQSELIYIQSKASDPLNSDISLLNYNSHKGFKRSAKRAFKGCPKLLEKINEGAYFPKYGKHLRNLADDYESLCIEN